MAGNTADGLAQLLIGAAHGITMTLPKSTTTTTTTTTTTPAPPPNAVARRVHPLMAREWAYKEEKGLLNPIGHNNCFLNVVIQSLWHLSSFRARFNVGADTPHVHNEGACLLCSLQVIFTQYKFSDTTLIPPDTLRSALAALFAADGRFQMNQLDDASEAFDAVLNGVHQTLVGRRAGGKNKNDLAILTASSGSGATADPLAAARAVCSCLVHRSFGLRTLSHVKCGECGAESDAQYQSMYIMYSYVAALRAARRAHPTLSFCGHLKRVNEDDKRCCPNAKCKSMQPLVHFLKDAPDVLSIGLVWETASSTADEISELMSMISHEIDTGNIFLSLEQCVYELRGMICYYGKHYDAVFLNEVRNQWFVFDDTNVRPVGEFWSDVTERCVRGRCQPCVLFYERRETRPVSEATVRDMNKKYPALPRMLDAMTKATEAYVSGPHNFVIRDDHVDGSVATTATTAATPTPVVTPTPTTPATPERGADATKTTAIGTTTAAAATATATTTATTAAAAAVAAAPAVLSSSSNSSAAATTTSNADRDRPASPYTSTRTVLEGSMEQSFIVLDEKNPPVDFLVDSRAGWFYRAQRYIVRLHTADSFDKINPYTGELLAHFRYADIDELVRTTDTEVVVRFREHCVDDEYFVAPLASTIDELVAGIVGFSNGEASVRDAR